MNRDIRMFGADTPNESVCEQSVTGSKLRDIVTYNLAASGLSKPAISLMPSTWIPSATSWSTKSR